MSMLPSKAGPTSFKHQPKYTEYLLRKIVMKIEADRKRRAALDVPDWPFLDGMERAIAIIYETAGDDDDG